MKKLCFSIILSFAITSSFGQFLWQLNFEDPFYKERIYTDTATKPNNSWQVGAPSKSIFTAARSISNAIMTDTLSPVLPNDTSVFYLRHERDNSAPYHIFDLNFWFQLDGDSTDSGKIEISPDNGVNWINMLTQDSVYQFEWLTAKPTLSGSTNGWVKFSVIMQKWASGIGTFPVEMTGDTILFRFTYITDSNSTSHDGWMMDDFLINDIWEGIDEIQNIDMVDVYPNPANDQLNIKTDRFYHSQSVQLANYQGQLLYEDKDFNGNPIDITHLPDGLYYLKYANNEGYAVKKFVVNR
jgi:hypothetical protein